MIDSLLYLTTIRPGIVHIVDVLLDFNDFLKNNGIFIYVKDTQGMILWYPGNFFDLVGYVDVDYNRYLVDRKSTFGMAYLLGPCLVSLTTKK